MSLLILMFHRADDAHGGNSPAMLEAHFSHLARHYQCVLPGAVLARDRLNVCLTFDDAYFDFYHTVYPLLRKHQLQALLAVSPDLIRAETAVSPDRRLQLSVAETYQDPERGGFCTWAELKEMSGSGFVAMASHGATHCRLDAASADLEAEIIGSRKTLEHQLGVRVNSFVFPYGRFSPRALALTRRHYSHALRIGSCDNRSWQQRVLYRVDADRMAAPDALFQPRRRIIYRLRYWWNQLRRR